MDAHKYHLEYERFRSQSCNTSTFLGKGAQKEAHKVCWNGRFVAVLTIRPDIEQHFISDSNAYKYFTNHMNEELDILKSVSPHPNIVSYLSEELSSSGYVISFTVELGVQLKDFLLGKTISLNDALFYIEQLFNGLSHIHSREICHRDLKPDALYIVDDSKLKISDFSHSSYIHGNNEILVCDMDEAYDCLKFVVKHTDENSNRKITVLFEPFNVKSTAYFNFRVAHDARNTYA